MTSEPAVPPLIEICRFLSDPALDGRCPGGEGHETAKAYLRELLDELGFEPLFDGSWLQAVNRGGTKLGDNIGGIVRGRSDRWILLGAHYDHFKGVPGADDNAAALAIVSDAARRLVPWKGRHSLVVCFFDLEEPPHFLGPTMGSVYFVEHGPLDLNRLTCAVVFDLCGHDVPIPGRKDAYFVLGAESSPDLIAVIRYLGSCPPPVYMFADARIGDMSDHHAFRARGCPYLFFSCGQWEHYHRPTDTFDRLNLAKMQRLASYLPKLGVR